MNAVESLSTYHGKGWIWTGLIRDSRMWMCWGRERAFQLEETEAWGVGLGQGRMWSAALCSGKSLQACRECLLLFLDLFGCCFWQPWVSLLHSWAFSSCGERGLLFIVVLGPLSGSFSCCGARECVCVCVWGCSSRYGTWSSCPEACGIFLDRRLNPGPLPWQADSLPLDPQGSLRVASLKEAPFCSHGVPCLDPMHPEYSHSNGILNTSLRLLNAEWLGGDLIAAARRQVREGYYRFSGK